MGIVRFILALVVASGHFYVIALAPLGVPLEGYLRIPYFGSFAVIFFFIISGFVISYTLSRNYESGVAGVAKFFRNRFVRIYSFYWPLVVAILALDSRAWQHFSRNSIFNQLTGIFLVGVDWNVAFSSFPLESNDAMIMHLPQSWALGTEISFYMLAPLLVWSRSAALSVMILALLTRLTLTKIFPGNLNLTYLFFPATVCFFLLGHWARVASDRWSVLRSPMIAATGLCGWIVFLFMPPILTFDSHGFWLSVLFFSFGVGALFDMTKESRWGNLLGDLSYAIFLIHIAVVMVLMSVFGEIERTIPGLLSNTIRWYSVAHPRQFLLLSTVGILAVVVLAAFLSRKFVEIPLTRALHRLLVALPDRCRAIVVVVGRCFRGQTGV